LLEKEILQFFKETNGKLDRSFSIKMEVENKVSLPSQEKEIFGEGVEV